MRSSRATIIITIWSSDSAVKPTDKDGANLDVAFWIASGAKLADTVVYWESIKHTPYAAMKERIARMQNRMQNRMQKAGSTEVSDLALPNGWKLAPAGSSVSVGRFPYEAIAYAGHIVVLNTGYYTGKDKPEVSIVDPATNQVSQTLHFDALFPSAQVGGDGACQ